MSTNVSEIPSPGSNFYLHVNKKWIDDPANKIPLDYSRWGGFTKLRDVSLKNQIILVKNLQNKADKTEEEQKIWSIWKASLNRFENWKNCETNYDYIFRELDILDSYFLPNKPIIDQLDLVTRFANYFHYSHCNGITNIFDFDKDADLTNSNNIVLDFRACGMSLPSREYYTETNFAEKCVMFKMHLENVDRIINAKNKRLCDNFVSNVFGFENELASCMMTEEQSRKFNEYFTNTTLTDLHSKINDLVSLKEKDSNFILNHDENNLASTFFERIYELLDLRRILRDNREKYFISNNNNVKNPPHSEHVTAYDGDAIRKVLVMMLNKNNFHRYYSFLQYKIINKLCTVCTKELFDEFFDFYSRKLDGQMEPGSEEKQSVELLNTYAGEMMGKLYVANYFPETYKNEIKGSIQDIIDTMRTSIKKNDWLTNFTKEKALIKLNKFHVKIGYPDVWKDYSEFDVKDGDSLYDIIKKENKWSLKVEFNEKLNSLYDPNEWLMTPQTVNAYFMPTSNEIVFPAAILQPPFYCKKPNDIDFDISEEKMMAGNDSNITDFFVQASNFGGICAVIAHEITHGYDDQGRMFDDCGNLNDWWDEKDAEMFNSKTHIMEEQTNTYSFVDTENLNKEYKLNGQMSMGENLADLGGISLALQAMTHRLKKCNSSEKSIRINQRILFKSYANVWKENIRKESMINQLTTDHHAPVDFRANIVKNVDEFYDVFKVTDQDEMYIPPAKRVRMW